MKKIMEKGIDKDFDLYYNIVKNEKLRTKNGGRDTRARFIKIKYPSEASNLHSYLLPLSSSLKKGVFHVR